MNNTVTCGNSIEVMNNMPDESVDLIFADPPYWMRVEGILTRVEGTEYDGCDDEWDQFSSLKSYEDFSREWLSACYRILKPNGTIWVIGGMQCIYTIGAIMQELGFWFINDVVWHKKNPTPNFLGKRLNNSHETLIWAAKSKKSKFTFNYKTAKELNVDAVSSIDFEKGIRKQMGSVWRFAVASGSERVRDEDGKKLHSTQKPLELLQRVIAISSKPGDIVLDPFGGTMTTGVAAKILGRDYIMIEQDSRYCEFGKRRLEQADFIPSDIASAKFDIKPLKVTMREMISNKYFFEDEKFYLTNGKSFGTLLADGKLLVDGKPIDMHTAAALAKNTKSARLNGFDVWNVYRDGELVSISQIRENYRSYKLTH